MLEGCFSESNLKFKLEFCFIFQPVRSPTPPENLLAVFDTRNDTTQAGLSQQDAEHGGARAKTYRNKENRNKNSAKKKNGIVVRNEEKAGDQQHKSNDVTAGWEPSLQFKRYNDDDDDLNSSETTCRKVINQSKQRKQNMNKNMMKNHSDLTLQSNTDNNDSLMNMVRIPLPAGLDPVSNPRNISNIYVKNVNNLEQGADNDLETDFYSVHHKDKSNRSGNSSQRLQENPNVTHIHNNLWEGGQIKDKNRGNTGLQQIRLDQQAKNTMSVVENLPVNDKNTKVLTVDDNNTTVLKLANTINLHRTASDSGLNTSIVVPYEQSGSTDNLMQLNSPSTGSSPHSLVSYFNTSPTASLTNSLVTEPLHFSDSLPSNLSSNVLFGDGISNDYIIAQRLQQQFDREHKEMQRLRQYDETPYRVTEGYNFADTATENCTLDYITANEYQTLNDSLTNNIAPVYDPREDERQAESQNAIYIPCENRVQNVIEDEDRTGGPEENTEIERDRVSPETRESHQLQNDEQYPTSNCPGETFYIPYSDGEGKIQNTMSSMLYVLVFSHYPRVPTIKKVTDYNNQYR